MPKYKYPLTDTINVKDGKVSPAVLQEDISIFQQSFLGLSIMDFTSNLGFNSSSSTLTVNLVEDDGNFYTPLHIEGYRNAVTEGYHPWDENALPTAVLSGETPCAG